MTNVLHGQVVESVISILNGCMKTVRRAVTNVMMMGETEVVVAPVCVVLKLLSSIQLSYRSHEIVTSSVQRGHDVCVQTFNCMFQYKNDILLLPIYMRLVLPYKCTK